MQATTFLIRYVAVYALIRRICILGCEVLPV